jgi:hypothetical protein
MNNRIKELAIEAGYDMDMQQHQKFAELIVAHAVECVRDVLRNEDSDLTYTAASQVQDCIKQHFGVEL